MFPRFVALAAVALCVGSAGLASADPPAPEPSPTPIVLPTMPPDRPLNPYVKMGVDLVTGLVRRELANQPNATNGEVTYFKRYELQVRYGPNGFRDVHLHQGTVINPRGATLAPGQRVAIRGTGQPDGSLAADVIDIAR